LSTYSSQVPTGARHEGEREDSEASHNLRTISAMSRTVFMYHCRHRLLDVLLAVLVN